MNVTSLVESALALAQNLTAQTQALSVQAKALANTTSAATALKLINSMSAETALIKKEGTMLTAEVNTIIKEVTTLAKSLGITTVRHRHLNAVNLTTSIETLATQLTASVSKTVSEWLITKMDYLVAQVATKLTDKVRVGLWD